MSDPMTRTDIEDVLSSIRRLVSEEARPEPKPRAAETAFSRLPQSQPASSAPKQAGRLVLTPALRVAEDVEPEVPADRDQGVAPRGGLPERVAHEAPELETAKLDADSDAPRDDADPADGEAVAERAITATIAELEAAVAARIEQWDPDGSEDTAIDENHEDAFDGPVRFIHRSSDRLRLDDTLRLKPADSTDRTDDADRGTAEADEAPMWTDNMLDEEFQPDDAGAKDAPAGSSAGSFHSARVAPRRPVFAANFSDPVSAVGPGADAPTLNDSAGGIEDVAPPEAEDWRDADSEGIGEQAASAESDEAGFEDGDDAYLDEDLLRDIVREMIRQELQGSLGERITRNVRKLVRAEINRAMASRDFD